MKLLQSEVFPILFLLSKWIAMSYQRPILRRAHSFSYKGVLLLDPLSWWCSVGILENWAKELKLKELFFKPQVKCGFSDYWKFVKTMVVSTEFRRKKSVAATVTHFHSQSCSNFWALDSVDSDTRLLSIYVISLAQSNYHHCLLKAHLYLCKLCAIETKAQDVCVCVSK